MSTHNDVPFSKMNRCSCTPIVRRRARTTSSSDGWYPEAVIRFMSFKKLPDGDVRTGAEELNEMKHTSQALLPGASLSDPAPL